ncbi:MAG TPA: hypothetical protein VFY29_18285, partial [Terriglobia bacterium]|nr:hypothetical protein [Terriglobia bacterium]
MKGRWKLGWTLAAILAAFVAADVIAGQGPARGGGAGARGAAPGRGGAPGGAQGRGGGAARGGRGAPAEPAGPTPRLPNGKPDLSGHWANPYTSNMATGRNVLDPVTRQPLTWERQGESFPDAPHGGINGAKAFDLPYTEWGLKQWLAYDPVKNGDYAGSCMPFGLSRSINSPHGLQMTQNNDSLAIMFEQNTWFHWIPTNGMKWPEDLSRSWNGVSVGHWDGDMLVVETTGFNGYTRLDTAGHPHSK